MNQRITWTGFRIGPRKNDTHLTMHLGLDVRTSGKTYTMVGTHQDPGLMVLSLRTIFDLIDTNKSTEDFEVTCSYLEVYNEVIYDLLERSSGHLELREDPEHGITVAGLRNVKVHSADKIVELLNLGNSRRKTESTEANATSSRSHAVLEIIVKRKQKNKYRGQVLRGKLALVDLAGSERASETNIGGQKLRDGANINRSLLALANCINALGKQQKKGLAYVPYRNSKLTRILKDGLSGNSRTVMVATISPADDQYHHTVNTLKYADRAKEIKTHIQATEKDEAVVQALRSRRQVILDNIRDNDEAGSGYQKEIEENEKQRRQLQNMIEEAIRNNGNKTYLHILSQYRLLGMANTELQFEIAIRDQFIHEQREAHKNLWNLLMASGLDHKQIMEVAAKQGITIEDWGRPPPLGLPGTKQSPARVYGRFPHLPSYPGSPGFVHNRTPYASSACLLQHHQDFSSMSCYNSPWDNHTLCRQEHHSSFYLLSHDHSPSSYLGTRNPSEYWAAAVEPSQRFCSPDKHAQDAHRLLHPEMQNKSCHWNKDNCVPWASFQEDYGGLHKGPEACQASSQLHEVAAVAGLVPGACIGTRMHAVGSGEATEALHRPLDHALRMPNSQQVLCAARTTSYQSCPELSKLQPRPFASPGMRTVSSLATEFRGHSFGFV